MTDPLPGCSVRPPRIAGQMALPPGCDALRLLPHMLADLRRRGCDAQLDAEGRLVIRNGSNSRGSVLAVVSNGVVWVAPGRVLHYAFSLRGVLLLCLGIALVAACLAWFTLDSAWLAGFGLLAPVVWLFGANWVIATIRVPEYLRRLCGSAPNAARLPLVPSTGRTVT